MKNKVFSTLIFAIPSLLSAGATTVSQRFHMEYLFLGPIYSDKSRTSRIIYKMGANTGTPKKKTSYIYVINNKHPKNGTLLKELRPQNDDGVVDETFTTYSCDENSQNQARIYYTHEDKTRTTHLFDWPIDNSSPNVDLNTLPSGVYEANNIKAYDMNRGYYNATNRYVFTDWYTENHLPIYNKFDIEKFSFEEYFGSIEIPVTYETFRLEIPANLGLFDGLTSQEISQNNVVFNLNLVNDGTNHYSLKLQDTLYVHPYTYKMSRTPINGYVVTKHFYLPKNGFVNQDKINFTLQGTNIGTMRLSFHYDFSIVSNRSRIGDCVTSQYCIQSEDAVYSELGKELNHD